MDDWAAWYYIIYVNNLASWSPPGTGLTFALLRGVWTPLQFFADGKKMAARNAAGFSPMYLTPHIFGNFCELFDPGSCKVRSPDQVKWLHHTKTLQSPSSYSVWGKVMKLSYKTGSFISFQNMIKSSVPTKCISRIFISVTSGQVIFVTSPL